MRIKRFSGKDLPAVVAQIKEEFGLLAIILSQRDRPGGGVEVTAGVRDEDLAPGPVQAPAYGETGDEILASQALGGDPEGSFGRALEAESDRVLPTLAALTGPDASPGTLVRSQPLRPVPADGDVPAKAAQGPRGASPQAPGPGPATAGKRPPPRTAPAMGAAAYRKAQAAPLPQEGELGLGREIASLREYVGEQLGEMRNLFLDLAHRQSLAEKWRDRPDAVALYRRLLATGLAPERAREFVEKSAESKEAWGGELEEHLRRTLRSRLRVLPPGAPLPRLVALTGPSGSGKTTSLVRLAAWYQKKGRKVSAITLDTLRLGAAEQLAQYARIMGLGLKACQNVAEFQEANELFRDDDLVLVDTNSRDFAAKGGPDDLASALAGAGARRLLVLPAGLKNEDLEDLHRRLAGPSLLGLVLTKLDETRGLGNVMGFLAGQGAPLAFLSTGPRTPEDFQAAKAESLLDYWLDPGSLPGTARK